MSFRHCDVASSGPHEARYEGGLFCRVAVSPDGAWAAVDSHPTVDRAVILKTSSGKTFDLSTRYPNNFGYIVWAADLQMFVIYVVVTLTQGRTWRYDPFNELLFAGEDFDASWSGSQGFLDVTDKGEIFWWDLHNRVWLDGVEIRSPLRRGDHTACVLQEEGQSGVIVHRHSDASWWYAYRGNVQMLPRISDNGTVAVSADPGGFYTPDQWERFDPHAIERPSASPSPSPSEGDTVEIPDQLALVNDIYADVRPSKTVAGAFEVTKRVAWALRHLDCGLLLKPGGENIIEWRGQWFSASRVVFPDGHLFKVLTDVPTTNGPSWQDEDIDEELIPRYVAAMDPGDIVIEPSGTDEPDEDDLRERVARLEQQLAQLSSAFTVNMAGYQNRFVALEEKVKALELRPNIDYSGKFLVLENRLAQPIVSKGRVGSGIFAVNVTVEGKVAG